MNMIELRDRLTEIIEENHLRGWSDRNVNPVYLRVIAIGRKGDTYIPIERACSGLAQFRGNDAEEIKGTLLEAHERNAIKPTRERLAKILNATMRRMLAETKIKIDASKTASLVWVTFDGHRVLARDFRKWLLSKKNLRKMDARLARGSCHVMVWNHTPVEVMAFVEEFKKSFESST